MIACANGRCRIDGDVTVDTVGGLLRELQAQRGDGIRELDFSGVARVDSAALALIFGARRQCGGSLACVGLPASFLTLAELYGVADLLAA